MGYVGRSGHMIGLRLYDTAVCAALLAGSFIRLELVGVARGPEETVFTMSSWALIDKLLSQISVHN